MYIKESIHICAHSYLHEYQSTRLDLDLSKQFRYTLEQNTWVWYSHSACVRTQLILCARTQPIITAHAPSSCIVIVIV